MQTAFLNLLDEHQAILHKVCRLYRDTAQDREDLFQEMVYHLWKAYPSFRGDSKVSSWMYRIALNTALATFRKREVRIQYQAVVTTEIPTAEQDDQQEKTNEMWKAIKQLPAIDKAIVTLYLDELSYRQIGDIIGLSESNVGARLTRIKIKLRKKLKPA